MKPERIAELRDESFSEPGVMGEWLRECLDEIVRLTGQNERYDLSRYERDQLKAVQAEVERLRAASVLAIKVLERIDVYYAGACSCPPPRKDLTAELARLRAIVEGGK